MSENRDLDRARAQALVHSTGLTMSDDEMHRLIGLYERFGADRVTLASAPAGESEPLTIFQPSRPVDRP